MPMWLYFVICHQMCSITLMSKFNINCFLAPHVCPMKWGGRGWMTHWPACIFYRGRAPRCQLEKLPPQPRSARQSTGQQNKVITIKIHSITVFYSILWLVWCQTQAPGTTEHSNNNKHDHWSPIKKSCRDQRGRWGGYIKDLLPLFVYSWCLRRLY